MMVILSCLVILCIVSTLLFRHTLVTCLLWRRIKGRRKLQGTPLKPRQRAAPSALLLLNDKGEVSGDAPEPRQRAAPSALPFTVYYGKGLHTDDCRGKCRITKRQAS